MNQSRVNDDYIYIYFMYLLPFVSHVSVYVYSMYIIRIYMYVYLNPTPHTRFFGLGVCIVFFTLP